MSENQTVVKLPVPMSAEETLKRIKPEVERLAQMPETEWLFWLGPSEASARRLSAS